MAKTITCPYDLCNAQVTLVYMRNDQPGVVYNPRRPRVTIIPDHDMVWDGPPDTMCIMSMILYPDCETDSNFQETVNQRRNHDLRNRAEYKQKVANKPTKSGSDSDSRSLRGPHRIGREPPPDAKEDWQLGGRKDDDIQVTPRYFMAPPWIGGGKVGRVSAEDILSMLNTCAVKAGEAKSAVVEALDLLQAAIASSEEAKHTAEVIKGRVDSMTLSQMITIMDNNIQELRRSLYPFKDMPNQYDLFVEKGEDYARRIQQG